MTLKTKTLLLLILSLFFGSFLILNILVSTAVINYTYEVNKIATKEKVVMLTFDDGPELSADSAILDILEAEQVSGTFFQIGKFIEERVDNSDPTSSSQYLALQKRMLTGSSYSWIGNHTYSHQNYIHQQKLLIEELNKTDKMLAELYQNILNIKIDQELVPTRLAYLQYFNGMDYIAKATNNEYFVRGYLGTDYNEAKTGKQKILQQYLRNLRPGQIYVCHTRSYAKEWLPDLIHILKNKGYKFASFNPNSPNYYKNFGKLVN